VHRSILVAAALVLAGAPTVRALATLSPTQARAALRADLRTAYGVRLVHSSCVRRSSRTFRCAWRGQRSDGRYHGHAVVTGYGHGVHVKLYGVRNG
jgi:hypothetical protein